MTDSVYIEALDNILTSINEASLTDVEILTITPTDPESLQEQYEILNTILENRGGGQSIIKLKANAETNNITIDQPKKDYSNKLFCFGLNNYEE